jgi:hypothetical protein
MKSLLTSILVAVTLLSAQAQPSNYGRNPEIAQRYNFEVLNYAPVVFEGKMVKEGNVTIDKKEFKVSLVKVSRVYRGNLAPDSWVELKRPTGATVENGKIVPPTLVNTPQLKGIQGASTIYFCRTVDEDFAFFEITQKNDLPKFRYFREDWVSSAGEEYNGKDTIPQFFLGAEVNYDNREAFYSYLGQIPNVQNVPVSKDQIATLIQTEAYSKLPNLIGDKKETISPQPKVAEAKKAVETPKMELVAPPKVVTAPISEQPKVAEAKKAVETPKVGAIAPPKPIAPAPIPTVEPVASRSIVVEPKKLTPTPAGQPSTQNSSVKEDSSLKVKSSYLTTERSQEEIEKAKSEMLSIDPMENTTTNSKNNRKKK